MSPFKFSGCITCMIRRAERNEAVMSSGGSDRGRRHRCHGIGWVIKTNAINVLMTVTLIGIGTMTWIVDHIA